MEFESQEFMRVEQSLQKMSPSTKRTMEPSKVVHHSYGAMRDAAGEKNDGAWWMAPFSSYYSQLAWGKICSLLQPSLNHHFSGSEIMPGLWISDHASVCDLQALQDRNIQHIICAVLGVKAMFPRHIQYTRLPLRDTHDEDIYQYFDKAADIIHDVISAGESILVHCRCGVSRSVTLVCAYLIKYHKMSHEEAIRTIQAKRACANPIQSFRNQLRSFEEKQQ